MLTVLPRMKVALPKHCPLLSSSEEYNQEVAVSYDIDKIGFCKETVEELKGKTLTLYTGVDYANFSFRNTGDDDINEREWFKQLKKLYGVSIKYIRGQTELFVHAPIRFIKNNL